MLTLQEADQILTAAGQDFEIVEQDWQGRHTRCWRNTAVSLRDILEHSRQHGDRTFLVYENDRLSFAEHYRHVASLAQTLRADFGIRKGDRVAIAMRNYPEWSIAFWATVAIGAVAVPLNAWWTGEELRYGLEDSGSRVAFVDGERLERLIDRVPLPGLDALIATRHEGGLPAGIEDLAEVIGRRPTGPLPTVELLTDDLATIFYTSGTTGMPKGALGTHRNICSNLTTLEYLARRKEFRSGLTPPVDPPQPASLLTVPLFHVTGCHSTLIPALKTGAKLVLVYKFDPEETVRLIEREAITSFGGVPAIVWQVIEATNFRDHDLSSLLRVGYGGAPAAPELVRRISEVFPSASPSNGYGLTESSSVTTNNSGDTYLERPQSIGPAVPVCEVRIVGSDGTEVADGEVGELWIRGPNIVLGYWNKPEPTAEAIRDGWLLSGDLVKRDGDGFLYIVDRAKDMVIRGGENVYCVEVEAALFEHPAVMEAAVFGRPHRILGEEVAAAVRLRAGTAVSAEELRTHAAVHLAKFKVPVHIELRTDDFPRNANGKILKAELKRQIFGVPAALGDETDGATP